VGLAEPIADSISDLFAIVDVIYRLVILLAYPQAGAAGSRRPRTVSFLLLVLPAKLAKRATKSMFLAGFAF
jgi:hypothetical protein